MIQLLATLVLIMLIATAVEGESYYSYEEEPIEVEPNKWWKWRSYN